MKERPPFSIRLATTDAEREAIYRLRYRVYVEEMRRPQKDADHDARRITDSLDAAGFLFGVWKGDECLGTVRCNLLRDANASDYRRLYGLESLTLWQVWRTSITTRVMVPPGVRRLGVSVALARAAFDLGLTLGISADFIDCRVDLVPFFTRLGYVTHRTDVVHPECGPVTIMTIDLDNDRHLRAVGSPLAQRGERRVTSVA